MRDWQNLNCLCRLRGYQLAEAKLKGNIGLGAHANDITVVIKTTHAFMLQKVLQKCHANITMVLQNYLFVHLGLRWPVCVFSDTEQQRHFPSILKNGSLYSEEQKFPIPTGKQSIKTALCPDCHRDGACIGLVLFTDCRFCQVQDVFLGLYGTETQ